MLYDYLRKEKPMPQTPQTTPTPGPTALCQMMAATVEVAEPVPYQGVKYARSDVKFVRLPLKPYLARRGLPLPEQFEAILTHMPRGTFLAGGAAAALACGAHLSAAADIDLFFSGKEPHDAALKLLRYAGKEDHGPHVPEGVTAFKAPEGREGLPIQAINIAWFETIEDVLDGFDFTATMFGVDVGTNELVYNPESAYDYSQRRLVNHRTENDESSKKRIAKYIAKGFKPVGDTLAMAKALGLWDDCDEVNRAILGRVAHIIAEPA